MMAPLPPSRRDVLVGTGAVGIDLLPYARPDSAFKGAPEDRPDAELIALVAQLTTARERRDEVDGQLDDAYDRHHRPEFPGALYWRRNDFMLVWIDRNGRLAKYGDGEDARWVYEDESEIAGLRSNLAAMEAADVAIDGWATSQAAIARTKEILAAHETWTSECKASEDMAGITALEEASGREHKLCDDLQLRVAATRTQTAAGFAAKARAAAVNWCSDLHRLEHEILPKLLAEPGGWEELWSVSLIVDAINFGATSPLATAEGSRT